MTTHELKVVQPYFNALMDGSKTFEVRRNDRGFQRGDELLLMEWAEPYFLFGMEFEGQLSGREVTKTVTYVYSDDPRFPALQHGYVILGLGETPA